MSWVVTAPVRTLGEQLNRHFPDRDRGADGTIGDVAHRGHASSHNPDDTTGSRPEWDGDSDRTPEVRARDIDKDLRHPSVTAEDLVQHWLRMARAGGLWWVRYMIYNGRLWHAERGWRQEAHTSDPHTDHIHITMAFTQRADEYEADWRLAELVGGGGDPMLGVRKGDRGIAVEALQRALLTLDPGALPEAGADGDYGDETAAALRRLVGGDGSQLNATLYVRLLGRLAAKATGVGTPGPQGPAGPAGPPGPAGPAGPSGRDGVVPVGATLTVTAIPGRPAG